MGSELTHINDEGQPRMVDVSDKAVTQRTARARSRIRIPSEVADLFMDGDITGPKGPVFQTAIIAGIMAAKKTHELIPFCHPLALSGCDIDIVMDKEALTITIICKVKVEHKTGVEMEALTGASVAALAVYDMLKAVSHNMVIEETRLIEKTGGKSDVRPDG
jgi:cyclic pyranopterin phosphate synthase